MFLNCHTYFSLRYGTLSPQQLIQQAIHNGISALALTDINNTSCTFEFIQLCKKNGIHPVAGIDFRQNGQQLYIGIAKNPEGFRQLNQFLENEPLPNIPEGLSECWIIYPKRPKPLPQFKTNEFLGIPPEYANQLFNKELQQHSDKFVILHAVSLLGPEDFNTHCLLRAIDLNTLRSKLPKDQVAKPTAHFIPQTELENTFAHFPQIIKNTRKILEESFIDIPQGLQNNRQHFTGTEEGDYRLLEKLALNGFRKRYGQQHPKAKERFQKELKVIRAQHFCSYFLITWDIIRYAQSVGYHHVGRGSGANSMVAFCLGITDVDPLELDLYFERFINPYRSSPPDFDIDFSWDERDDITDYIFKRYGKEYTALLATYNTFKGRSIIRELGKVYGLPKHEIDKIVLYPERNADHHDLATEILREGTKISGFPNYLSIHAGGIIISEKPLHYYTALQMMPKGFPIVHFDMHHAEDMGFHKLDILSQRGLGHIKDSVSLIRKNKGIDIDIHHIPNIKEDNAVKAQLRSGKCMGCFYIESPAMRGLLHKLRCDNYIHLVAASSIIRPGVASSGMMREFIRRFHQPQSFEYLHPTFQQHLGETFGVMVYQEDVMKILHHFAGLDLDESDVLRRIMCGKKGKGDTLERLQKKYTDQCKMKGYTDELSREVWRQIESFSGYSFCKAHSASFAVESFQSLYLKAYYPLEFIVAVINNFGGFYSTEFYFHEAVMSGAKIHAPCINHSHYLTDLQGNDVYVGFIHVQGMEKSIAHQLITERSKNGLFLSLEDFMRRVHIGHEQLEILIRIGAFRFTEKQKGELLWEKNGKTIDHHHHSLFAEPEIEWNLPVAELKEGPFDQHFDEIELLGFPLCPPFQLLHPDYEKYLQKCIPASGLLNHVHRKIWIAGYFVCHKNIRTSNGKPMCFATWIDQEGQFFDTTHFGKFPFVGKGIYLIEGKVTEDFGFPGIEVTRMKRWPMMRDERF
jgi:DNA-directed DNA polymerase III PolC